MSVTITKKYIVYNHGGTGVRHHHYTENNTVHDFPPETADENEAGNRTASAPAKYAFGDGPDLVFAFMSVTGAKDGDACYLTDGDYSYHVGTKNIDILAVYAPATGTGEPGGGPGVWVDAFNVNTGALSDDLHFISVYSSPGNVLSNAATFEANQEGDVPTTSAEKIVASDSIDGNAQFVQWKQIMPPQRVVTSKDQILNQNETGEIWIAFYQKPDDHNNTRPGYHIKDYSIWRWVDYATMVDGHGGPGDPGILFSPAVRELTQGMALAKTASEFTDANVRKGILDAALQQIRMASGKLEQTVEASRKLSTIAIGREEKTEL